MHSNVTQLILVEHNRSYSWSEAVGSRTAVAISTTKEFLVDGQKSNSWPSGADDYSPS